MGNNKPTVGKKIVGYKRIFTIKNKASGEIDILKAWLVAKVSLNPIAFITKKPLPYSKTKQYSCPILFSSE